jgi:hypothetical protein
MQQMIPASMMPVLIPASLVAHIITAMILVSLPSYFLIPILTYLTYESKWASLLIATAQLRIEEFFKEGAPERKPRNRSDSIGEWVKTHYDTLKRILEKEKEK